MATISNNDIVKAIYLISKDKTGAELALASENVVQFLARRRLFSKAKEMLLVLQKIINQEKGVIEVKTTSARKLSGEAKRYIIHALKKHYKAKEVVLSESLDEKLLGGVQLEMNDEVIDLSVRNKIEQLQEYLKRI
jgi:ATP synthase F1 delta subunit